MEALVYWNNLIYASVCAAFMFLLYKCQTYYKSIKNTIKNTILFEYIITFYHISFKNLKLIKYHKLKERIFLTGK